jgi:hypothetical protein
MNYTRLYADSDGETHFEDVEVEFHVGNVTPQGQPLGISAAQPTSDSLFVEINEAYFADYHPAPRKQWIVPLSWVGEFGCSDGETRRFKSGDVILVDDLDSKGHTARHIEPGTVMFVGLEE